MPSQRRTLFFEDVSFDCSEEDLHNLFSAFGDLYEVRFKREDELLEGEMPYGFVRFSEAQAAVAAKTELNGKMFRGRKLR